MSRKTLLFALAVVAAAGGIAYFATNPNGAPQQSAPQAVATGSPYEAVSKLPDWSGAWLADAQANVLQTDAQIPLTPEYAEKLSALRAAVKAGGALPGNPTCKPYGLPLSMAHQGPLYEFLFSPGHVVINTESHETRDIFTDREMPAYDFDRYNGTAMGRWEGDTLIVETSRIHPTVAILPGIENGGELAVLERIRLVGPDRLEDQITLTSPIALTAPYTYTVTFTRQPEWEMAEYVCLTQAHATYAVEGFNPTEADLITSSDKKPPVRQLKPESVDISLPGGTWASIATLPDWRGLWYFDGRGNEMTTKEYIPLTKPYADYRVVSYNQREETGESISDVYHCWPRGAPQMMKAAGAGFYLLYTPGRVTMPMGHAQTRRFFTDGRGHPPDLELSFGGHSIAHWENGNKMLVADTVGLRPDVQMFYGMPSGGGLRMEERFRQIGPDKMEIITTQYSKVSLSAPWTYNRTFTRHPEWDLLEDYCADNNRDVNAQTGTQAFDLTPPSGLLPPPAE